MRCKIDLVLSEGISRYLNYKFSNFARATICNVDYEARGFRPAYSGIFRGIHRINGQRLSLI